MAGTTKRAWLLNRNTSNHQNYGARWSKKQKEQSDSEEGGNHWWWVSGRGDSEHICKKKFSAEEKNNDFRWWARWKVSEIVENLNYSPLKKQRVVMELTFDEDTSSSSKGLRNLDMWAAKVFNPVPAKPQFRCSDADTLAGNQPLAPLLSPPPSNNICLLNICRSLLRRWPIKSSLLRIDHASRGWDRRMRIIYVFLFLETRLKTWRQRWSVSSNVVAICFISFKLNRN